MAKPARTKKPAAKTKAAPPAKAPAARAARTASPAPTAGLDDLELRVVAHDPTGLTVGGFAALAIAGRHGDALILTCPILECAAVLDLADPPRLRPLAAEFVQACGTARDGRLAALLGLRKKPRYARVFPPSLDPRAAVDHPMKKLVEFAGIGFTGDRIVAIPGHLGTHRRYDHMHAQVPYLQVGAALVPAAGLDRDATSDAWSLTGVMACGERDLIVWAGRLFERDGDTLVRVTAPDLADNHNNSGLSAVPTATGFFTISGQRLVEITPGSTAPCAHLPDDHFAFVRPGPGATLLLWGAHETAARAPMWLYDPATCKAVPVALPPDTYPMAAFYSSARDAFGALASASAGTDGHRIAFVPAAPARAALAAR
ncbi:MAG: hypothetical protein K8W52_18010 [Deltaproteobacteria bacterium]|nr:hypothetical protein [Deltaproteobacteria bacterium]